MGSDLLDTSLRSEIRPIYQTTLTSVTHVSQKKILSISSEERLLRQHNVDSPSDEESPQLRVTQGNFSCLEARIHLRRHFGYYIMQVYIPSVLIVILSWVSFWIDIDATPARVSVGLLTVLAISTQSSGEKSNVPRVSYMKALDLWFATCLVFVVLALLEFSIVHVQFRHGKKSNEAVVEREGRPLERQYTSFSDRIFGHEDIDFMKYAHEIDRAQVKKSILPQDSPGVRGCNSFWPRGLAVKVWNEGIKALWKKVQQLLAKRTRCESLDLKNTGAEEESATAPSQEDSL
ncbi:glycine receptor subunit alpha-3 [Plakobranchus ocellatus]|uniref:Glycine receptor subunit alpha-3 n=1 Tax=Plakobranchus ocellatus TaxID=259542 RepID=A0AAV3ZT00_9GAST|nr:glycine receptor subunit alpha-3 [Plakobranchus ocellatus]